MLDKGLSHKNHGILSLLAISVIFGILNHFNSMKNWIIYIYISKLDLCAVETAEKNFLIHWKPCIALSSHFALIQSVFLQGIPSFKHNCFS